MKKTIINILISVIIVVSCKQTDSLKPYNKIASENVSFPYHVDLGKNLRKPITVTLSNIGKKLEYIPLETNPNSLIKHISQLEISDSFIFISDFDKLLQFDREGNFIRQIGEVGRGPGEYIKVMGFCIDTLNEKVYIIAWGISTVLEFDFNGRFIRPIKIPFASHQLLVNRENSLIFHLVNQTITNPDSEYSLYITDLNAVPNTKIKRHYIRENLNLIADVPMYYFNDSVRFKEFMVDTLYTLKNEKLEPYAIFDIGRMEMDPDPIMPAPYSKDIDQLNQKLWLYAITENKQYLFLSLNYGISDSSRKSFYNKLTGENVYAENNTFSNDLDGGVNFWPKYVYNDSILIDYCNSFELLGHLRDGNSEELLKRYGEKYSRLEKLATGLDEMSNPILIVLKP